MGTGILEVRIGNKGQNSEQGFYGSEVGTRVLEVRIGNTGSRGQNREHEFSRAELGMRLLTVKDARGQNWEQD